MLLVIMQKKFKGILIFSKINKENDLFIKFLSNSDEIISGIVYGGLSKSKRNIYQVGFFLNFNVFSKPNRVPSISAELSEPYISKIINNKYKLNCLLSTVSLVNLSIIEGQQIKNIYQITYNFLDMMISKKNWISDYCLFLLNLLKTIGYEINYTNNNLKYFDIETMEFKTNKTNLSIIFPYELIKTGRKEFVNYNSINSIIKIFELVFKKNHLSNINLQLPNHYLLFNKLIIDYLKNNGKNFKSEN